jgi:hypothetical protein
VVLDEIYTTRMDLHDEDGRRGSGVARAFHASFPDVHM